MTFDLVREGANHTVYSLDGTVIPIPATVRSAKSSPRRSTSNARKSWEGLVEAMNSYTAHVTRDGKFWLIHIPEIDRHTQARTIREVETMARDLVVSMLAVAPGSFDLAVDIVMPTGAAEHLRRAGELRAAEDRARAEGAAQVRAAATELQDAGLSLRDIGALLGVSFQRAHQLTKR